VALQAAAALLGSALALVPAPAAAAPADFRLTPSHSFVHFEWPHAGLSTLRGRFDRVGGRITLDREARRGRGEVELRLDSVNTGRAALDAALRHALGADGEARATYTIDALRFDGDRPVAASGRLAWRGRDLPLDLLAERFNCYPNPLLRREVCGGDFTADIEPGALGLALDPAFGLGRPIRLRVQVEAIRLEPGE
jgi:polyisoprenoid-binding protein YceI